MWAAIWLVFLGLRFSSLDIRRVPGIGIIMLILFAVALLMPIIATALAASLWLRQPQLQLNRLTLGCAIAALLGQGVLFLVSRWL